MLRVRLQRDALTSGFFALPFLFPSTAVSKETTSMSTLLAMPGLPSSSSSSPRPSRRAGARIPPAGPDQTEAEARGPRRQARPARPARRRQLRAPRRGQRIPRVRVRRGPRQHRHHRPAFPERHRRHRGVRPLADEAGRPRAPGPRRPGGRAHPRRELRARRARLLRPRAGGPDQALIQEH